MFLHLAGGARRKALLLSLLAFILGACQVLGTSDDELSGRVIFWHGWSAEDAVVLEEALDEFRELNPDVTVVSVAFPPDELRDQFEMAAADGLGPDLILGPSDWIPDLADSRMIRPLGEDEFGSRSYRTMASTITGYQDGLYGMPLSLFPQALYYNKALVDVPAATLDELLEQAAEGKAVAFIPRFEKAYWGIQAFGAGLFDEEDNFTLAESGFTEWLEWLNRAQNEPGIILNVDDEGLRDLFVQGEIAYYVAGPEKLASLIEAIGEDAFGVTLLPEGPQGPAGPLLPVETILFYSHSSPESARLADILATFLTGPQQGIRFIRKLNRLPADPNIRVDSRLYPVASGFAQQARDAVILPAELDKERFYASGNRAMTSVLTGVLTPSEAACRFGLDVADFQGYSEEEMTLPASCEPTAEE